MSDTGFFRLGTFSSAAHAPYVGMLVGDRVTAVEALAAYLPNVPSTMQELLSHWQQAFDGLHRAATAMNAGSATALLRQSRALCELQVHAPLPRPGTIYCSGANYKKHVVDLIIAHHDQAQTQGMTLEQKRAWGMNLMDERARSGTPFIFIKPQSAVTGPFDPVIVPFDAVKPDWELELGVVIGRPARRVPRERALEYVAGYTVVNDITLRERVFRRKSDSPELGMDFTTSKGAPTFLPMGPYLVPAQFVQDPQKLRLTLKLNGEVMQDEETSDMIFTVARLIEYLSHGVELQPGDIICTGSPAGNGMHYNRFIREGDVLESSITGVGVNLGTQRNQCILERS